MRVSQLGLLAITAGVQGFLVPPEISAADAELIKTLPLDDAAGMLDRTLQIECPGCPVITDLEGDLHSIEAESVLQLAFTTSHKDGVDQLLVNGIQIYPIDLTSASAMQSLTARQMINTHGVWQYAAEPKLGFSLAVNHPTSSGDDSVNLVKVHLEVFEVANTFISGIPSVDLKLIEMPSGQLIIANSDINVPASPAAQDGHQCSTLLCKWRATIANRLSALKKGCGRKRPTTAARPAPHHDNSLPHPGPMAEPHHLPHGQFRAHQRFGFAQFVRGLVSHVLVPILIGVMVAVTAFSVGMAMGHIVILTWRLFFRRGGEHKTRCGACPQEDGEEDFGDETKAFLAHQGPPPQYEDAEVPEKKDDK